MRFPSLETVNEVDDGDEVEFFTTVRYVSERKKVEFNMSRVNQPFNYHHQVPSI